jgi:hypothetical protein
MAMPHYISSVLICQAVLLSATWMGPAEAQPGTPWSAGGEPQRVSGDGISYTVPSGWHQIAPLRPNAVTYQSATYSGGEVCRLSVFRAIPSSGDLATDARRTFAEFWQIDPLANAEPPFPYATVANGVSPEGWPYFMVRHSINGRFGEYGRLFGTITLAVGIGKLTVVILGSGKDPQVSMCFGELVHDEWPGFFASLHVSAQPTPQFQRAFLSGLVGTWSIATATVGGEYTFTAQGRYLSAAAFMQRSPAGASRVLETTSAYFGDGRFSLQGNSLVLMPDAGRGNGKTAPIRLEQVSQDVGRTWQDRFCLNEGGGEVCYRRTR